MKGNLANCLVADSHYLQGQSYAGIIYVARAHKEQFFEYVENPNSTFEENPFSKYYNPSDDADLYDEDGFTKPAHNVGLTGNDRSWSTPIIQFNTGSNNYRETPSVTQNLYLNNYTMLVAGTIPGGIANDRAHFLYLNENDYFTKWSTGLRIDFEGMHESIQNNINIYYPYFVNTDTMNYGYGVPEIGSHLECGKTAFLYFTRYDSSGYSQVICRIIFEFSTDNLE